MVAAVSPVRPAVPGELVRIDWDVTDDMSLPPDINLALKLEVEPYLISVGQIVVEDATNHLVVGRIDPGDADIGHAYTPEITPAMIAVGEDVVLGVVGGADLGALFSASDLAERVFLAMR